MIERQANLSAAVTRVRIGCIGSRDLPSAAASACRQLAGDLARGGFHILTGSTPGEPDRDLWADWADGAFAYGAARVSPASLSVYLPWRHFPRGSGIPQLGTAVHYPDDHPEWTAAAAAFWEAHRSAEVAAWAEAMPRATRLRHARNVGIVLASQLVLAWPHGEAEGTRFAMRFAAWREVPVLDLTQTNWWTVAPALAAHLAAPSSARPDAAP